MAGVNEAWSEMRPGSRIGLFIGVALLIGLMSAGVYWLTRENYAVLFSDIEPQDASSIVSELKRMKARYRLEEGGTRIMVPEKSIHDVRLELMGSEIPLLGGVGFEIFDDSDFGMTEFAQKVNFQRALQGELTRTIMSLEEVKYARVHVVLPERGLFKRKDSVPSASVTVFLKQGNSLSPSQISGIQRLVAAAVPELSSAMVTVADHNGVILSRRAPEGDGVEAISNRLQKKMEIEKYLTEKVLEVLERTFEPGEVHVSVDATLNFSQVRTTQENVLPNGVGNLVRKRESRIGNVASKNQGQDNVTTEVEYRIGREVAQIIEMPGEMVRLSIGVVLPPGVPAARLAQIRELVATSIGLNPERGDAIVVYSAESVPVQTASIAVSHMNETGHTPLSGADSSLPMVKKDVSLQLTPGLASAPVAKAADEVALIENQASIEPAVNPASELSPIQERAQSDSSVTTPVVWDFGFAALATTLDRFPLISEHVSEVHLQAAVMVLVLLVLVLITRRVLRRGRKEDSGQRITQAERKKRLTELRAWLGDEPKVTDKVRPV